MRKIAELRIGTAPPGILFELKACAAIVRAGLLPRFAQAQAHRTPDLIVDTDHGEVAVECKKLLKQNVDRWMSSLMSMVMPHGPEFGENGFDIELDVGLTFLRSERPPTWNDALARALAAEVAQTVALALRQSPPQRDIRIPGIAKVRVRPDASGRGQVSGGPIYEAATLRRILDHLVEACTQIPPELPGVVVVECDVVPVGPLVRAAIAAAIDVVAPSEPLERVHALLLSPDLRWANQRAVAFNVGTRERAPEHIAAVASVIKALDT
ncbi:MAG: hypothetical protein QM783_12505 [Phycisphaerales bacterium]